MDEQRFSVYFALDGPNLDGLIGSAGILRFDWPERKTYVQHFYGISSAHNPSLAPNGRLALLGNFSQTIMLLDIENPNKIREVNRQSTMYFEEIDYRLRANTHHLWYPDSEHFIGAIGDHIYRFDVDDLKSPENLAHIVWRTRTNSAGTPAADTSSLEISAPRNRTCVRLAFSISRSPIRRNGQRSSRFRTTSGIAGSIPQNPWAMH